jgi:hypothetical protein
MKQVLIYLGIAAALVAAFLFGRVTVKNAPIIEERVDTVVVYKIDTITRNKPVYVTNRVVDTMLVQVRDTLMLRDTVYMALEREQKEYTDSLYRAWVSGYQPTLDSILIYATTKIVEIERVIDRKPKRWGLGVSAGFGATVSRDRTVNLEPYIGIGINYNLVSW